MLQRTRITEDKKKGGKRQRLSKKTNHEDAFRLVDSLWGLAPVDSRLDTKTMNPSIDDDKIKEFLAARSVRDLEDDEMKPFANKTLPHATLYAPEHAKKLSTWLEEIQKQPEPPTPEQLEVLRSAVERLQAEAEAEQKVPSTAAGGEPIFDLVHGVPGSGKSQLIMWMQEAFVKVLGWTHGVQFVCFSYSALKSRISCTGRHIYLHTSIDS